MKRIRIGEVRAWARLLSAAKTPDMMQALEEQARPHVYADGLLHWPDGTTTEGPSQLMGCIEAYVAALPPARKRGTQVRVDPQLLAEVDAMEPASLDLPVAARLTDKVDALIREGRKARGL